MDSKKPWQSKTILVNAFVGVCMALSPLFPVLQGPADFLKGHVVEFGVLWSVLNIALRAISKDKIALAD